MFVFVTRMIYKINESHLARSHDAQNLFLCSQNLHGFGRNLEKVSQVHEMSVSKKRVHTKRTTLNFFVRNGERFPLLFETNNALRANVNMHH